MPLDYNKTLNLLKTDFPMRAGLPKREPEMLEQFERDGLYEKLMEHNAGKPLYVLHDGPPYANGSIHLGTALNKVLKDFVIRYKNMAGYKLPYIPGYDTHGLPIELKAIKALKEDKDALAPVDIRRQCKEFALEHLDAQKNQFKRLGVLGDWDHPYLTLKPEYEAKQIEIFGEMAKKGYIFKGLKPVYWCSDCETALAEAEIEYEEDPCDSVYVKFHVTDDKGKLSAMGADLSKTYFVIWTTTTWTLPGNVAICVGPRYDYVLIRANGEFYVMAEELYRGALKAAGIEDCEVLGHIAGADLEYIVCRHPFIDRDSLVIVGDHVTTESGTGCVHTAPGHGVEDFEVCQNYKDLPIVVPVDAKGYMTADAGQFEGLTTVQANKAILEHLKEIGALFATEHIIHQYAHCWRCHKPVLYRATEQWFCSLDGFRDKALEEIKGVNWIPGWGEDRISNMVRDRSDWCISRQRVWGVPIPIFYCKDCGKEYITDESIAAVADLFRKEGSDAWYTKDASEILPEGATCPHCGGKGFTKETDIMDVWFDSGVSHAAVVDQSDELTWPADLYLEGADQYRGWFQSSLLTSVAWRGKAPYKTVVTHGWVVDGEGRKMSKSLGNGIDPLDIVKEYGADILRLWVASSDYHADIRISKDILKQLSEGYRKIRNTARFILGNIGDFNPDTDSVSDDKLEELDRWALMRLNELIQKVTEGYDTFEFHQVFHAIHNFCVVDMSNFYLDVCKDRLYVENTGSVTRRAAQTAMYRVLDALTRMIAPILAFTGEEIWQYLPRAKGQNAASVLLNDFPKADGKPADTAFMDRWEKIHAIREDVKKALELARADKVIGASLDAKVVLYCSGETYEFVKSVEDKLAAVLIVSQVEVEASGDGAFRGDVEGLSVTVLKASGEKCERCWIYSDTVGSHPEHPTLCARCADVVNNLD